MPFNAENDPLVDVELAHANEVRVDASHDALCNKTLLWKVEALQIVSGYRYSAKLTLANIFDEPSLHTSILLE